MERARIRSRWRRSWPRLQAAPAIEHLVCVTAQHRKMLDDLLALFAITPDYDLDVMTEDQTLTEITTRVLAGMEPVLQDARPDVVLVHGDTTTSTAAALAAFYQQIPVGHVEAGLRTSNRWLPYPEEMNRRLTATIASYHFAPTLLARKHLLQEHVVPEDIVVTGNTVIDAFLETAARDDLPVPPRWNELDRAAADDRRDRAPAREPRAHARDLRGAARNRRASDRARSCIGRFIRRRASLRWRTRCSAACRASCWSIRSITPRWWRRLKRSSFVLTDSGGLQEEAPCLGKPVLVMREETERPEGLRAGTLRLVGHDRRRIVAAARALLDGSSRRTPAWRKPSIHMATGAPPRASPRGCWRGCAAGPIPSRSSISCRPARL